MYLSTIERISLLILVATHLIAFTSSGCPGANPNDYIPDDVPLQACLDLGGTLLLDPGTPGYIIGTGLFLTVNTTTITSSCAPTKATLIAGTNLSLPILQTDGIIFDIVLQFLIVDGNKEHRGTKNAINCIGTNNLNYRTTNILLPGFLEGTLWNTWDPYLYVSNVLIEHVHTINSPCGTGIGIQGRNYEIRFCEIADNGWDTFHNPQNLSFPYADGINAAVCNYGYIHDNIISDNTNMQVTAGPGPYCRVERNIIKQTHIITQCAINIWPTNVWMTELVWWHPAPWNLAHSSISHNTIYSTNDVNAGAYSGLAVGALPWANVSVTNTGFVYNNTVSGANINLLVDGVIIGTIWGNTLFGASNSNGKTSSWCAQPQNYTVAKSQSLFLQPGFAVLSFDLGSSCFPTGETITSTFDNAKFVNWIINGVAMPSSMAGVGGSVWTVAITFINTGTSIWQDIVGDNGYKLGDAINTIAPLWGVYRASMISTVLLPGSEYTFQFSILLPTTPGIYQFQWQLVQELVNWFGENTPSIPITIS